MKYILKIFIPLLLICACIAGVVSGIRVLTAKKIAENEAAVAEAEKLRISEFLTEIYGHGQYEYCSGKPDTVNSVMILSDTGSGNDGYCVDLTSNGYQKNSLHLLVAFDSDGSILRVCILSSNETTGIGTKVENSAYLSQYTGKSGTMTLGGDIDKVAGATLSSKGVIAGVNTAYEALVTLGFIGGES